MADLLHISVNMAGLWWYQIGDYRVICQIEETHLTMLVVQISHRNEACR